MERMITADRRRGGEEEGGLDVAVRCSTVQWSVVDDRIRKSSITSMPDGA